MTLPASSPPATPLRLGASLAAAFEAAYTDAERRRHARCTLEHLLLRLLAAGPVRELLAACGADVADLERDLSDYLELAPELPDDSGARPAHEPAVRAVLDAAAAAVHFGGRTEIDGTDLLASLMKRTDAYAALAVGAQGVARVDVLRRMAHGTSDRAAFRIAPLVGNAPVAVVLHNDPYTPMELVTSLLATVFDLPDERARALMLEAHSSGSSRVGSMGPELARDRAIEAMRRAEEAGFPLRCTIEAA